MSQLGIFVVFIISLVAVVKGADWLVDSAVWIAKVMRIPQIIVGATIVSLGTTLPEALVSTFAAVQGKSDVVLGTTIGSILFNTAVILGVAVLVRPTKIEDRSTFSKVGTMVAVLTLFTILASDGSLSRFDGIILLIGLILYMATNIWEGAASQSTTEKISYSRSELVTNIRNLVIGAAFVVIGARLLLDSGTSIARILGVPEAVIAITLFAVGSSLPELVTGLTAALKGHTGIVLGNVFGANTLNLVFAVGLSTVIQPLGVAPSVLLLDIPAAFAVIAVLLLPAFFTRKITRVQGLITAIAYFAYIALVVSGS